MLTLKPFDYYEPVTVKDAAQLLDKYGAQAQVMAGGIDLIPRMRKGKIKADYLVNIQNIPQLSYLTNDAKKGLRFGAMTKLHELELSSDVQKLYPVLYAAIHQIASVQTKYMGTAVGNLCVATPASDVATALVALGAQLEIAGPNGERAESVEKFYLDYLKTSLKKGEFVTGVMLPAPPEGLASAYLNLLRTKADIAKISVGVALTMAGGICKDAKISLGAVAPTVFRASKAEAVLKDQKITPEVIQKASDTAAAETSPISDVRSTAEYRKQVAVVLVKRAIEQALEKVRN